MMLNDHLIEPVPIPDGIYDIEVVDGAGTLRIFVTNGLAKVFVRKREVWECIIGEGTTTTQYWKRNWELKND